MYLNDVAFLQDITLIISEPTYLFSHYNRNNCNGIFYKPHPQLMPRYISALGETKCDRLLIQ